MKKTDWPTWIYGAHQSAQDLKNNNLCNIHVNGDVQRVNYRKPGSCKDQGQSNHQNPQVLAFPSDNSISATLVEIRHSSVRYAVHLANDSTIYITVISAGCPARKVCILRGAICNYLQVWYSSTMATKHIREIRISNITHDCWTITWLAFCLLVFNNLIALFKDFGDKLYQTQIQCFQSTVVQTIYPPLNILHVISGGSRSVSKNSKYWGHRPRCANDGPSVHDLKGDSNDQLNATDKISSENLIPCWLSYLKWLRRCPNDGSVWPIQSKNRELVPLS